VRGNSSRGTGTRRSPDLTVSPDSVPAFEAKAYGPQHRKVKEWRKAMQGSSNLGDCEKGDSEKISRQEKRADKENLARQGGEPKTGGRAVI